MKKLIYFLVIVIIIYLISIIYRNQVTPILINFPTEELGLSSKTEARLNLVLFFSRKNCPPCVRQVVEYLNNTSENINVLGIVTPEELQFLDEVRLLTGATFQIKTMKKWKKYRPNYAPTLYGIGPDGKVYFILACTGLEGIYLHAYVDEFMRKADYLLRRPYLE